MAEITQKSIALENIYESFIALFALGELLANAQDNILYKYEVMIGTGITLQEFAEKIRVAYEALTHENEQEK